MLANADFFRRSATAGSSSWGPATSAWRRDLRKLCADGGAPQKAFMCARLDEGMSHLIEAGSDFFVMPSLFEPCGLNQMYSQVYGTVPIVSRVGGLVDTVRDVDDDSSGGTGLMCEPNAASLRDALERRPQALCGQTEARGGRSSAGCARDLQLEDGRSRGLRGPLLHGGRRCDAADSPEREWPAPQGACPFYRHSTGI